MNKILLVFIAISTLLIISCASSTSTVNSKGTTLRNNANATHNQQNPKAYQSY